MAYKPQKSPADTLLRLRKKLRAGELDPVYLFYMKPGERDKDSVSFLIAKFNEIIHEQFKTDPGAKFNIDVFEGSEVKVMHALTVAKTSPMFGSRRLTVFRSSSGVKEDDSGKIISYLSNPPAATTLVLSYMASKLPEKLLSAAAGSGYAHRIESLNERSLTKWISGIFKEEGLNISGDAVGTLAQFAGCDLQVIEDAKEKLLLYTLGRDRIEARDVEELLLSSRSADIYELVDALWARNTARVMMLLGQLERQKTDALYINTILAQQLRGLIKVKSLTTGRRMHASQLASILGLREFIIRKHLGNMRRFSLRELEEALSMCGQMNIQLKSSRMNAYRIIEKAALRILSLQV